ncbi:mitochondrial CIII assembly factor Cbp3 (chaperone) [Andalucia godoyi]|uniref:Mitochondrial CIII assembly factor Cbp3 (Chaperone) n=1 Tax=Andalucia godoyi TaxID=505711 RepID=A0A8K0F2N3_ANDGO|nr:mitochondrial CIII assembly factor Cbp3 (chaperone) [Andalucia godoyi]|eukprot:ANDGO_06964.mRNA.1 mitochondrial CIII assembly factor Cbp3 (chaperone)
MSVFGGLLRMIGYHGNYAMSIRSSREVYARCMLQASSADMIHAFLPTKLEFSQKWEFHVIHVWLVLRRLRSVHPDAKSAAKDVSQKVFDRMWEDSEKKVLDAGVSAFVLSRYVKKLQQGFYGSCMALDLATSTNAGSGADAVLAGALFRNLHECDSTEISAEALRNGAVYIRAQLNHLSAIPDAQMLAGDFAFLPWENVEQIIQKSLSTAN